MGNKVKNKFLPANSGKVLSILKKGIRLGGLTTTKLQIKKGNKMIKKNVFTYVAPIVLIAFALLTLFLSSSVIFDWFGIRAKEGNYVLFVVWANFISSVLYLIAAYGFLKQKKVTFHILSLSALILIMALIGLFIHINSGGLYETKTIGAMIFRIIVTLAFVLLAYLKFIKNEMSITETRYKHR